MTPRRSSSRPTPALPALAGWRTEPGRPPHDRSRAHVGQRSVRGLAQGAASFIDWPITHRPPSMGVTKMPRNKSKRTLLEGGARHTVIVHNSGNTNMKTISAFLSLALGTLFGFLATHRALAGAPAGGAPQMQIDGLRTYSSLDRPEPGKEDVLPPGTIKFQSAGVLDVLKVYQPLPGRMLISSENLPTPAVTLENTHPLTRR